MPEEKKIEVPLSQQYPKWKFHKTKKARVVQDPEEEAKLGAGWQDKVFPPPPEEPEEEEEITDKAPSHLPAAGAKPAPAPTKK